MRHGNQGRKLNRTASHRKAMWGNMTAALIKHEQIKTTLPKAKDLRPVDREAGDPVAPRAKDLHARRQALAQIKDADQVTKLFDVIGPRYPSRPGGYTRVLKAGLPPWRQCADGDHRVRRPRRDAKGQDSGPVGSEETVSRGVIFADRLSDKSGAAAMPPFFVERYAHSQMFRA